MWGGAWQRVVVRVWMGGQLRAGRDSCIGCHVQMDMGAWEGTE